MRARSPGVLSDRKWIIHKYTGDITNLYFDASCCRTIDIMTSKNTTCFMTGMERFLRRGHSIVSLKLAVVKHFEDYNYWWIVVLVLLYFEAVFAVD